MYGDLGHNDPERCPGQCVPLPPLGFDGPALLWSGNAAEVPACPDRAPAVLFEGYEGLNNMPLDCSPCECSAPGCKLPAEVTASTFPTCPNDDPSATLTPLPVPPSWSGACISIGMLDPVLLGSLTFSPTTEEPCVPVVDVPAKTEPGPSFTIRARACGGEVEPDLCQDPGHTCVPTDEPPPPGFRQCILSLRPGKVTCPADYPEEVSFFAEVTDNRACAPCTCTQTVVSQCDAALHFYDDMSCSGAPDYSGSAFAAAVCYDPPSLAVQSMSATWLTNQPGACVAGGGEPTGEVALTDQQTFCCQKATP